MIRRIGEVFLMLLIALSVGRASYQTSEYESSDQKVSGYVSFLESYTIDIEEEDSQANKGRGDTYVAVNLSEGKSLPSEAGFWQQFLQFFSCLCCGGCYEKEEESYKEIN